MQRQINIVELTQPNYSEDKILIISLDNKKEIHITNSDEGIFIQFDDRSYNDKGLLRIDNYKKDNKQDIIITNFTDNKIKLT
jgi:hypothetical protein